MTIVNSIVHMLILI